MALPLLPGVYIMKDAQNAIIYIGKAKALKNRVSQYFGSDTNHPEKVRRMVSHVTIFDYIVTDSEFEALVLECSFIKQYNPKYNILLKDAKGYHYVRISRAPLLPHCDRPDEAGRRCPVYGAFRQQLHRAGGGGRGLPGVPAPHLQSNLCEGKRERPCLNHYIQQCCAPVPAG